MVVRALRDYGLGSLAEATSVLTARVSASYSYMRASLIIPVASRTLYPAREPRIRGLKAHNDGQSRERERVCRF